VEARGRFLSPRFTSLVPQEAIKAAGVVQTHPTMRFCPEVRGWAALRLAALVPAALREAVRREATEGRGPRRFRRDALALVSRPDAITWARQVMERVPALGPAAGPACLVRLWVSGLVRPGGALAAYWPDLVSLVWRTAAPALRMTGLPTRGPRGAELKHEVAVPLAWVFVASLSAGRRDLRLLDSRAGRQPDEPPFGWAPGIDPLGLVLRYLVLDQVPRRFRSHAFLSSPLSRLLRSLGLARLRVVGRWRCPVCRAAPTEAVCDCRCPHCGGRLVLCRTAQLLSPGPGDAGRPARGSSAAVCVPERAEARLMRRTCLCRASALWGRAVEEGRHGVAATVVLGALAGVRPLVAMADRPRARREWLERLLDVLAEERLDREPVAAEANAVLEAVAARLGRRRPAAIAAAYVGVLATRFRRVVFHEANGIGKRGQDPFPQKRVLTPFSRAARY